MDSTLLPCQRVSEIFSNMLLVTNKATGKPMKHDPKEPSHLRAGPIGIDIYLAIATWISVPCSTSCLSSRSVDLICTSGSVFGCRQTGSRLRDGRMEYSGESLSTVCEALTEFIRLLSGEVL